MKTTTTISIILLATFFVACSTIPMMDNQNDFSDNHDDPYPDSHLFRDVSKEIKDTVLKRLWLNIEKSKRSLSSLDTNSMSYRTATRPVIGSTVRFIPVISEPYLINNPFKIDTEKACLYGTDEKGQTVYYTATYTDRSHYTKDTNPMTYNANVEVFGQEFADKVVASLRDAKGVDRWRLISFSQDDSKHRLFEHARSHSDDGTFFIVTIGNHSFEICYFKDGQPVSCREEKDGRISTRPVKGLSPR